jgi:predicted ATPase
MAIKLAIAGTHSTGKTTLLNSVADALRGKGHTVARVSDLAVEARNCGFPILRDHTFASTLWIMARGITLELEAELRADVVLIDRPVPDAMGYLVAALKHRGGRLSKPELDYLQMLVKQHAATYHRIFKTTIDQSKPIDSNKLRDMDPRFRADVDIALDQVFSGLKISFESLNYEPDAARAQILQQATMLLNEARS